MGNPRRQDSGVCVSNTHGLMAVESDTGSGENRARAGGRKPALLVRSGPGKEQVVTEEGAMSRQDTTSPQQTSLF